LISKEIYLIDAEFFEMLSIFGAYYIVYSGGKDGAVAYFEERKNVSGVDTDNQEGAQPGPCLAQGRGAGTY
jgi:hypothetical protein